MSPADNIIEKCGGVAQVARICGCSENWVYRWKLPESKGGTGGRIPGPMQAKLIAATLAGQVRLKLADFQERGAA